METINAQGAIRPNEGNYAKPNLKGYKREAKFRRLVMPFFNYWDRAVKARSRGKELYVHNMESLCGEVLDKFNTLKSKEQKIVLESKEPFSTLSSMSMINVPRVFKKHEDVKAFNEVFNNFKFEEIYQ